MDSVVTETDWHVLYISRQVYLLCILHLNKRNGRVTCNNTKTKRLKCAMVQSGHHVTVGDVTLSCYVSLARSRTRQRGKKQAGRRELGWKYWGNKVIEPNKAAMDPSEVEFLAEKEMVKIIPNFSLDKIYLIGVRSVTCVCQHVVLRESYC